MLDNQFHGKGKFTFASNDTQGRKLYTGLFENGQFHGNGTMQYRNGDKCAATWERNELTGRGKQCLKACIELLL